jgi:hypothetical protein
MRRRPKTPEELRADLKAFDAAWKREMTHVMRNAVERMMAAGSGRRLPAKYKMKLPQLLRTVSEPSRRPVLPASTGRRPSRPAIPLRRSTRKKIPQQSGETRLRRAAEMLKLKRYLAKTVDRMRAFRDRRPMRTRLAAVNRRVVSSNATRGAK